MELKLKNVTSYQKNNFTTLNLDKKINLLYGHNGSGKSTISNYFYNTSNEIYNECKCSLLNDYRPLVYNSKFIEDNFYNTREQKGVFTLSKENADIEKQLLEKENVKQELKKEYIEKRERSIKLTQDKATKENEYTDAVWIKTEHVRTSDLKGLMKGLLGSKKSFFSQVMKTPRLHAINLNQLIEEYSDLLRHKNNEIPLITPLVNYMISEDDRLLLATPIIDQSNSYLSETIKKLQNLDWVKKGKESYLDGNTCPFCQEKTITVEFSKAIESIFDESYSKTIDQISQIKTSYEIAAKKFLYNLTQEVSACELISQEEKDRSISYVSILGAVADKNIEKIAEKIKNPSTIVTLEFDVSNETKVIEDITRYNNKIKEINIKVKKFKDSENSIRSKVWGAIKDLCFLDIDSFSKHEKECNEKIAILKAEMEEIANKGKVNSQNITELRNQISNIDATIDSINLQLKNLGIYGFSIRKHTQSEDKYIISRADHTENQDVYKSLSEGEKTLITFLYFLECCKGKTDKEDTDARNTLIVIDDPISSLSQNYVYDIASMIHHKIIKSPSHNKVLILTHNLYFFHELIKLAPDNKQFKRDYQLARITKNEYSIITEIEKSSIQNEYQSLWQILKDAKLGKINKIIIPNIMRNILEYYFAFVHRTDRLHAELSQLANDDGNNDFKAFYRYINRGSHSDAINITDMGDIGPEKYLEQLKMIFSMTGHEKHYLKMMDEDEEDEVVTA